MTLYRKKPVVIEAFQWFPGVKRLNWALAPCFEDKGKLFVDTLEGRMCAEPGDFIIKGVKGEVYPCKPDIFAATYEEVKP